MWARYWAYIVLTSALIYVYFNGIGLPFQQMFLVIPPKPTVIHPLFVKIYTKNFCSPLSALCSPLYAHILEFPIKLRIPRGLHRKNPMTIFGKMIAPTVSAHHLCVNPTLTLSHVEQNLLLLSEA